MSTPATQRNPWPWPLVAVAGWVVPGLGHAMVGEGRRGVIVGIVLVTLFFGGLLIGGIDAVDRRRDTLAFVLGQMFIGPLAFGADYAHQQLESQRSQQVRRYATEHHIGEHEAMTRIVRQRQSVAYRTSISRVNEVGTLYCAIAGALNLLAILDAVGRAAMRLQVPGLNIRTGPGRS